MLIAQWNNLGSQYYQHGCATIRTRSAGGSDDWHEGNVGIPPSLWVGLMLTWQDSLSCGFPSSVQEVLRLDIRLDSLCFSRHAHQEKRGYNHGQKSAET